MLRTVSMMQPYLFPYLGYFQLIALSDVFVLGDDLQYVKGSWMNRNRVLVNGQPKLITFPLRKGHQTEQIRERWLCDDFDREAEALMKMLERCYAKAPQRDTVLPLIRSILAYPGAIWRCSPKTRCAASVPTWVFARRSIAAPPSACRRGWTCRIASSRSPTAWTASCT